MKLSKCHNVRLKAMVCLIFLAGLLAGTSVAAEELTKEEQWQFVQTILRDASAEIPKLPDDDFSPLSPFWIAKYKVDLLKEVARGQGTVSDREGLRATAARAVRLAQDHDLLLLPLSAIGTAQVKSGFLEDAAMTAEGALESLRMHISRHGMDGDLPEISWTFLRAGKIGKALETAHMIVDIRRRAIALRQIGFQEAKNGHEMKAKEILVQSQRLMDSLDDPGDKVRYAIYGATDQLKLNRKAEAAKKLRQAKTLVQKVTDYDGRVRLYIEIAQLQHKWDLHEHFEESVNRVVHVIEMTSDVGSRVAQYADFSQQLIQSGHKPHASALLMKARQDVLMMKEPSSKVFGFLSLAEGEAELGHVKAATKLVRQAVDALIEMEDPGDIGRSLFGYLSHTSVVDLITPQDLTRIQQKVNENSNADYQNRTKWDLLSLAILQVMHGYFDQSIATTSQIKDAPSFRGLSIKYLGKELIRAKGIVEAMVWAKALSSKVEKAYAHIGIAEGILEALDVQTRKEDNKG